MVDNNVAVRDFDLPTKEMKLPTKEVKLPTKETKLPTKEVAKLKNMRWHFLPISSNTRQHVAHR